jgi:hypothetical protein
MHGSYFHARHWSVDFSSARFKNVHFVQRSHHFSKINAQACPP